MVEATLEVEGMEGTHKPLKRMVRTCSRHRFHANVRALPLDGRLAPFSGITDDISTEGVFISSVSQPPADALVLLNIYAPRGNHRVQLLARVVHAHQGVGYGCEFLDLNKVQRGGLDHLVQQQQKQCSNGRVLH